MPIKDPIAEKPEPKVGPVVSNENPGAATPEPDPQHPHHAHVGPESGPGAGGTLSIGTVVLHGPPPDILADPVLLAGWQDIQDGYLTAEAQARGLYHEPIGPTPSPAFVAGFEAYVAEHTTSGDAIGPLPPGLPTGNPDELTERILEILGHGHDPHTEVKTKPGKPPPRPVFE